MQAQSTYPLLAGVGHIKAGKLRLRQGSEIIEVAAPARYLDKLFTWCQGDLSLVQISALSAQAFGDDGFSDFVAAMLAAGILIDARQAQFHYARVSARAGRQLPPADTADTADTAEASVRCENARTPGHEWLPAPGWLRALLARAGALDAFGQREFSTPEFSVQTRLYLALLSQREGLPAGIYRLQRDGDEQIGLRVLAGADLGRIAAAVRDPAVLARATALLLFGACPQRAADGPFAAAFPALHLWAGAYTQACLLASREQSIPASAVALADHDDVAAVLGVAPQSLHGLIGVALGRGADPAAAASDWQRDFRWSSERCWPSLHVGRMALALPERPDQVVGWGRDIDPALAYDKALAEAVERLAYRQSGRCESAQWGQLPHMCRPDHLIRYSAAQYRSAGFPFRAFDADRHYLWYRAEQMHSGRQEWVVADCIFARSTFSPAYQAALLTAANSSGCASGRDLSQASESALFEVLERDAFMRHWLAQRGGTEVRQQTLPASWRSRLAYLLQGGGRLSLQILDLGMVPVWFAFFQDADRHFSAVATAGGRCGEAALSSLFSEIEAGVLLRRRSMAAAGIQPRRVVTPDQHAALYGQPAYFRRADRLAQCRQSMDAGTVLALFPQTMQATEAALRKAGTYALCADLTIPGAPRTLDGTPLVSVRVLVPHAIPITFGAGRLPLGMVERHERGARFPHPFP